MAMLLLVIEVQHLVGMLAGLGEIAPPKVGRAGRLCATISRSASPVASAVASISFTQSRDSATRPWARTLVDSPQKMGSSASWR